MLTKKECSSMKCFRLLHLYLHIAIIINFFCSLHLHGNFPFTAASIGCVFFLTESSKIRHWIIESKTKKYMQLHLLFQQLLSHSSDWKRKPSKVWAEQTSAASLLVMESFTLGVAVTRGWRRPRIYQKESCDSVFAISSCCALHSVEDFPEWSPLSALNTVT